MQNEKTLLGLGFEHFSEWDFFQKGVAGATEFYSKNYRLEKDGKIFRAYVFNSNSPDSYIKTGVVSDTDVNKVKRWMDCCSSGSIQRRQRLMSSHDAMIPRMS